jgi:hypothetical protein
MNIYHRVFKLHKRGITPQQIAVTTNMPIKSVMSVIKKIDGGESEGEIGAPVTNNVYRSEEDTYLDYNVNRQHKYIIADFLGFFTQEFKSVIDAALQEALKMGGVLVAIKLHDIFGLEEETLDYLMLRIRNSQNIGKKVVLLSPSDAIEKYISDNSVEKEIKVFGTQTAFEEYAYRVSHND